MTNYSKLNKFFKFCILLIKFFLSAFDHVQKIKNAMRIVENSTCIKFIHRTNEKDFVTITGNSYHCGTKIGRRGGLQILSILNKEICFQTSSILHELLHVLGFHHMHLSTNRDEFIEIIWENVKPEKWRKFRVRENLQDLNVEYDYGSIMHYTEYAHSKNGNKTMIPLKNTDGVAIGQRVSLSDKDILKINRLYDCDEINEIPDDK